MGFVAEERGSDSLLIESVTRGRSVGEGVTVRPAECNWHLVFVRTAGQAFSFAVGPLTMSGMAPFGDGAEILWVKFRLGAFMPHHPTRRLVDTETALPHAAGRESFWLHGSAWQFPDFENVEVFVERLRREGGLAWDSLVAATLEGRPPEMSPRTLRHRFLQATGQTQGHIGQVRRAQQAAALLEQGKSILDTVFELGYYDQPHLTRALRRFVGVTPGEARGGLGEGKD